MRLERPGIGVLSAIVTELLALDLTIPTDRGDRATVRGAVIAILGIAIILPKPHGYHCRSRHPLVGRAANTGAQMLWSASQPSVPSGHSRHSQSVGQSDALSQRSKAWSGYCGASWLQPAKATHATNDIHRRNMRGAWVIRLPLSRVTPITIETVSVIAGLTCIDVAITASDHIGATGIKTAQLERRDPCCTIHHTKLKDVA